MDTRSSMEWTKPELIILVRSRPEEAVLDVCKHPGGQIPAPNNGTTGGGGFNMGCQYQNGCLSDNNS